MMTNELFDVLTGGMEWSWRWIWNRSRFRWFHSDAECGQCSCFLYCLCRWTTFHQLIIYRKWIKCCSLYSNEIILNVTKSTEYIQAYAMMTFLLVTNERTLCLRVLGQILPIQAHTHTHVQHSHTHTHRQQVMRRYHILHPPLHSLARTCMSPYSDRERSSVDTR